jgi:hypothetical protein
MLGTVLFLSFANKVSISVFGSHLTNVAAKVFAIKKIV